MVSFNIGFGEHHFLGVDKSQCPPYEKSLIVYQKNVFERTNPPTI
jgi:hypothetical protein